MKDFQEGRGRRNRERRGRGGERDGRGGKGEGERRGGEERRAGKSEIRDRILPFGCALSQNDKPGIPTH